MFYLHYSDFLIGLNNHYTYQKILKKYLHAFKDRREKFLHILANIIDLNFSCSIKSISGENFCPQMSNFQKNQKGEGCKLMGFTYSCSIPRQGHSRTTKWQFLFRSRLQINFALILSGFQMHCEESYMFTGDPVSLTSFPAIWVQLLCTTTIPVIMVNSAWFTKNQARNSLLMLSKGCQSNTPSEEAWNMAYTCIYVPSLSSKNHKQIWQRKGEDYFCFEEEKYGKSYSHSVFADLWPEV